MRNRSILYTTTLEPPYDHRPDFIFSGNTTRTQFEQQMQANGTLSASKHCQLSLWSKMQAVSAELKTFGKSLMASSALLGQIDRSLTPPYHHHVAYATKNLLANTYWTLHVVEQDRSIIRVIIRACCRYDIAMVHGGCLPVSLRAAHSCARAQSEHGRMVPRL